MEVVYKNRIHNLEKLFEQRAILVKELEKVDAEIIRCTWEPGYTAPGYPEAIKNAERKQKRRGRKPKAQPVVLDTSKPRRGRPPKASNVMTPYQNLPSPTNNKRIYKYRCDGCHQEFSSILAFNFAYCPGQNCNRTTPKTLIE
jgi:hypothetical protein